MDEVAATNQAGRHIGGFAMPFIAFMGEILPRPAGIVKFHTAPPFWASSRRLRQPRQTPARIPGPAESAGQRNEGIASGKQRKRAGATLNLRRPPPKRPPRAWRRERVVVSTLEIYNTYPARINFFLAVLATTPPTKIQPEDGKNLKRFSSHPLIGGRLRANRTSVNIPLVVGSLLAPAPSAHTRYYKTTPNGISFFSDFLMRPSFGVPTREKRIFSKSPFFQNNFSEKFQKRRGCFGSQKRHNPAKNSARRFFRRFCARTFGVFSRRGSGRIWPAGIRLRAGIRAGLRRTGGGGGG